MNELQIFNNPEFGTIRTIEVNGEPWLVGKDVAAALGYSDTNKAIAMHVDDEDKLNDKTSLSLGQRGGWLINESGLYSLVLSSKLPGAKKFRRWVTAEVLPAIRKTGGYNLPKDYPSALRALADAEEKKLALMERNDQLQTELDKSKEWYSIKRVARINGVSYRRFDWRRLKRESIVQGYGVKKVFDQNYGEVNVYHMNVWERVYPEMEL